MSRPIDEETGHPRLWSSHPDPAHRGMPCVATPTHRAWHRVDEWCFACIAAAHPTRVKGIQSRLDARAMSTTEPMMVSPEECPFTSERGGSLTGVDRLLVPPAWLAHLPE